MTELGRPGAILLLSTYDLGHAPQALATMAASLEAAGFAPRCIDLAVEALPAEAVSSAELIVFSTPMHTALRLAIEALEKVVAIPSAKLGRQIAFVGMYAALHRDTLAALGVDWVLGGELETELVRMARAKARGERVEPQVISTRRQSLPPPRRVGLDLTRYARFVDASGAARLAGYTEATRGCLERCRHCPVPAVYDGRFVAVSADTVIADVAAQVEAGAEHITFGDPDFLNGPTHSVRICRELHRRWPRVTFDFTSQVANLLEHRAVVAELVELGCAFAVTAVESLSDEVLSHLRKRHRAADVAELLELAKRIGLCVRPTLVAFTPWTQLRDIVELTDWIAEEALQFHVAPVQMSVRLLVPPGSLLLPDRAFGPFDDTLLAHPWIHADPRVDALAGEIAALVEARADVADGELDTHARIRRLAHVAADLPAPRTAPRPARRVPKVSEPWFC